MKPLAFSPKRTTPFFLFAVILVAASALAPRMRTAWGMLKDRGVSGEERVANARASRGAAVRELCRASGLPYPPRELFLRAFKREAVLEAWAREDDGSFRLLKTFAVTASSGQPGPKRREGDQQVPEGFYVVERFNPESRFHLSLGLNYPNASDRILSDRNKPGFDIFIHGGAVTVGCLPIGDEPIEELYLLALDVRARGQRSIPVHIFPARMAGPEWEAYSGEYPAQAEFWRNLQPGFDAFESTRLAPEVTVEDNGRYRIAPR